MTNKTRYCVCTCEGRLLEDFQSEAPITCLYTRDGKFYLESYLLNISMEQFTHEHGHGHGNGQIHEYIVYVHVPARIHVHFHAVSMSVSISMCSLSVSIAMSISMSMSVSVYVFISCVLCNAYFNGKLSAKKHRYVLYIDIDTDLVTDMSTDVGMDNFIRHFTTKKQECWKR